VDAKAFRGAVVRQLDRHAVRVGHQDLQIGCDHGAIAVELDKGQPAEMRETAADRDMVLGAAHHRGDRFIAVSARMRVAVEHAVVGIDGAGVVVGGRIGARRMARDQIVDFEPVLDGANSILGRGFLAHDEIPPIGRWATRYHMAARKAARRNAD
jgi:hypothetical protein